MDKKKKLVIIVTTVAIVVFCVTFYLALFYAPTDEIPLPNEAVSETTTAKNDPSSYPVRLSIPKLNIDANIQEVGITKKGNMATPNNFTDVGWYKYGVSPGEEGSAVMAGHVDNGLTLPGVFYNLNNLGKGDDVFVITKGGGKLHFIVSKIDTYDFDARNTNVFTEQDGKLLKLITCTGTWVPKNKTHDKRLVVTAKLAEK